MKNSKVRWIARTAVLIALLVALQAVTRPLGNTIITGSIVNMMLVISVMSCGLATGLTVAAVSPVMAAALGIAPNWLFAPFIALGNLALVTIWHLIGNRKMGPKYVPWIIALVTAAVAKFLIMHFGVVGIVMGLPFRLETLLGSPFSLPQCLTASIGGVLAIIVFPTLKKAINSQR